MRSRSRFSAVAVITSLALAACGDPIAEQAARETRHDPVRADAILAFGFRPGTAQLDAAQLGDLNSLVGAGRSAQRDEFIVVTDGSGGPAQQIRAEGIRRSLAAAGARWVSTAIEPTMTMGPARVVVVRSEYRIGMRNCPDYSKGAMWNPNESAMPGMGCSDAYNMGQMLARPRDAAIGRDPGPADGTIAADAIQRYRRGRVRVAGSGGTTTGAAPASGGTGGSTTN